MGVATRTKPAPYFRTQRPGDPDAEAGQLVRDTNWTLFSRFAEPGHVVADEEAEVTRFRAALGWKRGVLRNAICAHAQLQRLPKLRELQAATRVLDLDHLCAIDEVLRELGPDPAEEAFQLFDDMLAATFTPTRANQPTPLRNTITARMREIIKRLDPGRAYDPKRRKERAADTNDDVAFHDYVLDGAVRSLFQLTTNGVTNERIRQQLLATARELKTNMAEAAIKLLTGEITPTVRPTLYLYTPKGREAGEPVFIPGFGWSGPEETLEVDAWLDGVTPRVVDLDQVAGETTDAYRPTAGMRALVMARDGTCVYPGCAIPAERCQLDHRVPFDDGGPTTPDNLFCLCARHHNLKTDRRAVYLPDPETGDIVWLFADGTFETSARAGFLGQHSTPTSPRWRQSLDQVMRSRAHSSEFYAKCHAVLDRFDQDGDLEAAEASIAELERKYGMYFPVKVMLPERPYLPPEPDDAEPPFPDPESSLPESIPRLDHRNSKRGPSHIIIPCTARNLGQDLARGLAELRRTFNE